MRLLVQRVLRATVEVDGFVEGRIGSGLVLSLCFREGDTVDLVESLAAKALQLNLWPEMLDKGKPWKSNVVDNGYEVLVILQPSLGMLISKLSPGEAEDALGADDEKGLFEAFVKKLQAGYQEEMVVSAPLDEDLTVETTGEGHYIFDVDPDGPRSARERVIEATTRVAMSAREADIAIEQLEPNVIVVTKALQHVSKLTKSKATLESCRVFGILSQKAFRVSLSEASQSESDAFAEALDCAAKFFSKRQQEQITAWTGMKISAAGLPAKGAEEEEEDMDLDERLAELQEEVVDPVRAWRRQKAQAKAKAVTKAKVKDEPEDDGEWQEEEEERQPAKLEAKVRGGRQHPDWKGRAAPDTSSAGLSEAAAAARNWVQNRARAQVAGNGGKGPPIKGYGKGKRPPRRGLGGIASLDHSAALHGQGGQDFQYGQLARYTDQELRSVQAKEAAAEEQFDYEEDDSAGTGGAPQKKARTAVLPAAPTLPKGTPTLAPMCPEGTGEEL